MPMKIGKGKIMFNQIIFILQTLWSLSGDNIQSPITKNVLIYNAIYLDKIYAQ